MLDLLELNQKILFFIFSLICESISSNWIAAIVHDYRARDTLGVEENNYRKAV